MLHRFAATLLTGALLATGPPLGTAPRASPESGSFLPLEVASDSAELRSRARDAQSAFERSRIRFSPRTYQTFGGICDERIGRMCIRITRGTEDGWVPPPEDPRLEVARTELLSELGQIGAQIPGDVWVLGQRFAYLGEAGEWHRALELARECPSVTETGWWCLAMEGTAAHYSGSFLEAERAFEEALEGMPPDLAEEWRDLTPIVELGLHRHLRSSDPDSLRALEARVWRLAQPLYLIPGNDHRTEHLARHTLARIRSEARNPYGMQWGGDLTEVLVRYGPEVAFQQQTIPPMYMGPTPVLGRFNPRSRGFLPLEDHLLEPSRIPPGSWRTDDRGVRGRHAPSYSPRIGLLQVQQARFRRGDDLLLVMGWTLGEGEPVWTNPEVGVGEQAPAVSLPAPDVGGAGPPFSLEGSLRTGLFFLPAEELDFTDAEVAIELLQGEGEAPRGIAWGRVPAGGYLASLELLDVPGERGWRARHGVEQSAVPREVVILSDLLLMEPDTSTPSSGALGDVPGSAGGDMLESHLARVLPGGGVTGGLVEVAWEVYGLTGDEGPITFRLSAAPGDRGLVRRVGELLGLLGPASSAEVSWQEGPEPEFPGAPVFRRVEMDLSALPPGPVRLSLALELPGRTGTTAEVILELLD